MLTALRDFKASLDGMRNLLRNLIQDIADLTTEFGTLRAEVRSLVSSSSSFPCPLQADFEDSPTRQSQIIGTK
jgi:hypothetical protein